MKKSLLLSAISVAGAAALVGGMTFASFNDYEDPQGPVLVAAGTLELDQQGFTSPLSVKDMKPGDVADFTMNLQNEGTLDGILFAQIVSVIGSEDGCVVNDPEGPGMGGYDWARVEAAVDPDCRNLSSGGDLVKYLTYKLEAPDGTIKTLPASGEVRLGTLLAGTDGNYTLHVKFADTGLTDKWVVDQQNDAQGDGASITLQFALVQS